MTDPTTPDRAPLARVEIVIEVPDVAAAAAFYEASGLLLHGVGEWERGPYAELRDAAGTHVTLIEGDGGVRIGLTVDDAAGAFEAAIERGATLDSPVTTGGGGQWGEGRDPWGNAIGFWSAT